MSYIVRFTKAAERQLDDLTQPVRRRVVERLVRLSENPRARGVSKLQGNYTPALYRAKIGRDHRVVFTVDDDQQVLLVTWVGNRRDAYRRS